MYELIYNRIISNLLLWVPSAPNNNTMKQPSVNIGTANPLLNINMTESISIPFSMAKSNIIFGKIFIQNFHICVHFSIVLLLILFIRF